MPNNISYKRGVFIKTEALSGIDVFMYVDTPGVYLNAYGTEVSEELAKQAGFDVEKYGKEKLKRERMAAAMTAIEQELQLADEQEHKVVAEKGGFKVKDLGLGRAIVEDPDGNKLVPTPIPVEQAKLLLKKLVPDKAKPVPAPAAAQPSEGA